MPITIRRTLAALAACTALAVAACADDPDTDTSTGIVEEDGSASGAAAEFPITVDAPNGPITIAVRPERIVSLSPSATEMAFAVGAGDQVVAVDEQSDYPPEVPTTELSAFEFNVEAVAAYEPDLVLIADDSGDNVDALRALDITVLNLPAAETIDDTYAQIEVVGEATGHGDEAAALVDTLEADVLDLTAGLPRPREPLTYYHELDSLLFTVTSETFIGHVYAMAGLVNVADEAGQEAGLYPQLSAEYLVAADPDLIFLADTECCRQNVETLAARPGFADLTAVREGNVIELSDDVASRWGPRVVDFLRTVIEAVERAA